MMELKCFLAKYSLFKNEIYQKNQNKLVECIFCMHYYFVCGLEGSNIFKKILINPVRKLIPFRDRISNGVRRIWYNPVASHRVFSNGRNISHLPTMLLIVGYPIYWIELYFFKSNLGKTSFLAPVLFILISFFVLFSKIKHIKPGFLETKDKFKEIPFIYKWLFSIGGIIVIFILLCALNASLLPPHLTQEFDALNYHITLPRQHLITGTFQHIPWSPADLFLLPIDFALSPFWLASSLPNKFPQFLFLLGLIFISYRLASRFSRNNIISKLLIIFAIAGSHGLGIQMGTAMLDIVICYLFLAALDSFLSGAVFMSAVELAFYFWSKPFMPIQNIFIFLILFTVLFLVKKRKKTKIGWCFSDIIDIEHQTKLKTALKKIFPIFCGLSILVGGPFMAKSTYYAGTPLYPAFAGAIKFNTQTNNAGPKSEAMYEKSKQWLATRDDYGSGRSFIDFVKHLWLIAIPEEGVNNRYDYPVGLVYLLFLGPFLYMLFKSLWKKQISLIALFIIIFWGSWWMGTHQTRFLYIPILLMYILVISEATFNFKTLLAMINIALIFTALSVFRAHYCDFGRSPKEVLRPKDKQLIMMAEEVKAKQPVKLNYYDVAFATFPVEVINNKSLFVLEH